MKSFFLSLILLSGLLNHPLFADRVDEQIQRVMQEKGIPGMSVVVIKNGTSKIYTYGVMSPKTKKPVRDNTLFEIGSITKVFTATAAALEIQNKRIKLNEPIKNFFPSLKAADNNDFNKLTLEQLLTHSSSLPRMPPPLQNKQAYNKDKILQYLKEWKSNYPVGTKYLYSNLSYGLAGFALEQYTGNSLIDIYRRLILKPLGMYRTEIEVPHSGRSYMAQGVNDKGDPVPNLGPFMMPGGGALKSNAVDMEKFLAANMGLRGPANIIQAMKYAQEPRFQANKRLRLGLGWQNTTLEGYRLLDKNGGVSGFSSYIGFIPERNVGVVILANRGKINSTKIGRNLLEALLQ